MAAIFFSSSGLPVTAAATPHHLLLTRDDIPEDAFRGGAAASASGAIPPSTFFKMAPPLATKEDRAELRRAVKAGALMFATDHAPHPPAKKLVAYADAANGIVGLETAVAITYQAMVVEEAMPVEDWARAWHELPAAILLNHHSAALLPRRETRVVIGEARAVDTALFASLSRNCPYHGMKFTCWPL